MENESSLPHENQGQPHSPAVDTSHASSTGCAVVWDFDWSFINENSDTYVISELAPSLIPELKELMKTTFKDQWTALMDHMVGRMMVDCGVTVSQLNKCLCNIPIFEENLMALKLAKTAGWQNFILSDANHHYIDVILQHHDINSSFIEIATNGSRVESTESSSSIGGVTVSGEMTRLRIYPHQSIEAPHSCSLCPQNLCKGNVLDKWREEHSFSKVVYIGDGGGDFCPVVRLKAGDVALCRRNYTLHKMCIAATSEVASDAVAGHRVEAHVVEWSNGQDILSCFRDVCKTVSDVDDSKL